MSPLIGAVNGEGLFCDIAAARTKGDDTVAAKCAQHVAIYTFTLQ